MTDITKALINSRYGPQRVTNKNTHPFAESNLITIKIEQMLRIKELDGAIINSNDETAFSITKDMGCEIVKLYGYSASDEICMSHVYEKIANNASSNIILYANCTNPILQDNKMRESDRMCFDVSDKFGSLNSSRLIKEFLFKDDKPLNYNFHRRPRSLGLPKLFALNFAINIIPKKLMMKHKNVIGTRPLLSISGPSKERISMTRSIS